jgi:hypothetical protein
MGFTAPQVRIDISAMICQGKRQMAKSFGWEAGKIPETPLHTRT